jgi:hypothetical protein
MPLSKKELTVSVFHGSTIAGKTTGSGVLQFPIYQLSTCCIFLGPDA